MSCIIASLHQAHETREADLTNYVSNIVAIKTMQPARRRQVHVYVQKFHREAPICHAWQRLTEFPAGVDKLQPGLRRSRVIQRQGRRCTSSRGLLRIKCNIAVDEGVAKDGIGAADADGIDPKLPQLRSPTNISQCSGIMHQSLIDHSH